MIRNLWHSSSYCIACDIRGGQNWGDKLEAARTRLMFTSSCTPGTGILFPAIAAYQNDIPGNTRNSRFFQGMENLLRPENKFNLSVYLTDPFLPPSPMAEASRCCCKLTEKQTNQEPVRYKEDRRTTPPFPARNYYCIITAVVPTSSQYQVIRS